MKGFHFFALYAILAIVSLGTAIMATTKLGVMMNGFACGLNTGFAINTWLRSRQ